MADADRTGAITPALWRAREIGVLQNRLARLATGTGGVLLIEGEPGSGRSTLLAATAEHARAHGISVLCAAADEPGQHFPLLVLQDALDDPALASVGQVLSRITDRLHGGPVLLLLDDLQWADETTLLAWYRLARLARSSALLLVAALRPAAPREDLERLRRALDGLDTELMTLGALAEEVVRAALMTATGQAAPADPAAQAALTRGARPTSKGTPANSTAPAQEAVLTLAARIGGNARYLADFVAAAHQDHGDDATVAGAVAGAASIPLMLPSDLAATLERRIGHLSRTEREILRTAALLGDDFPVTDLAAISDLPTADLRFALEHLRTLGLLGESPKGLRFRHPILRDALYQNIPPGIRLLRHPPIPPDPIRPETPGSGAVRPDAIAFPVSRRNHHPAGLTSPAHHPHRTAETTRVLEAEALYRSGDWAQAHELLTRTPQAVLPKKLQGARQGLLALIALHRDDLPRNREPAQLRSGSDWKALTPAETGIAELVAEGHTNADIAARLHVSRRTVEGHVSHVLAKLGLRSRVELARDAGRRKPALAG